MRRVGVVVVTRNRRETTLRSLGHLLAATGGAPVTVVDNGSHDGTAEAVLSRCSGVRVVRLPTNLGAAGRNSGVAVTSAPYIAFSDDDSWWAAGALDVAADLFDAHPGLGLVAGRVLVGADERVDPVCEVMADSPLRRDGGPGVGVLGFVACGAVVRRSAYLETGGFRLGYGVGGEEELLAIDLRASGWDVRYCPEIVAHHHPATDRPPGAERRRRQARNSLRTTWLRRRLPSALRCTAELAWSSRNDAAARRGTVDTFRDAAWILRERIPVDRGLERELARL